MPNIPEEADQKIPHSEVRLPSKCHFQRGHKMDFPIRETLSESDLADALVNKT